MGRLILVFALISIGVSAQNLPQWDWARNISVTYSTQSVIGMCLDDSSNIYVAGNNSGVSFYNTFSVAPGPYIAKYNKDGSLLWAKNVHLIPIGIKCDKYSNVYLCGNFTGSLVPEPGFTLTSNGYTDIFYAKYDENGLPILIKSFGGTFEEQPRDFAVTPEGESYMTASFFDHTNLDSFCFNYPQASFGVLFKLNSTGVVTWVNPCDIADSRGPYVRCDHNGNVAIIGSDLAPNCPDYCMGLFMSRYNSQGALLVNKPHFVSGGSVYDFQIDLNNDILLLRNNERYEPNKLEKYDSLMNMKWTRNNGDAFCYGHTRLAYDENNNIYATGVFGRSDPPCESVVVGTDTLYRNGEVDLMVSKLDPSGNYLWHVNVGGKGYFGAPIGGPDYSGASLLDKNGNLYIFSDYSGENEKDTVVFNTDTILNDGSWVQSCITKLHVANPIPQNITKQNYRLNDFSFYPNPSKGKVSISEFPGPATICVYDIHGRCIYNQAAAASNKTIDITGNTEGVYVLEVTYNNTKYYRKLILE